MEWCFSVGCGRMGEGVCERFGGFRLDAGKWREAFVSGLVERRGRQKIGERILERFGQRIGQRIGVRVGRRGAVAREGGIAGV